MKIDETKYIFSKLSAKKIKGKQSSFDSTPQRNSSTLGYLNMFKYNRSPRTLAANHLEEMKIDETTYMFSKLSAKKIKGTQSISVLKRAKVFADA